MTELDELFARSRDLGPRPSGDLMARVLADAAQVQVQVLRAAPRPPPRPEPLVIRPATGPGGWLMDLFGGAGALAGVLTAGVAGLVLGYVQPVGLSYLGALLTPSATVSQSLELMPGLDALLTEE